VSQFEATGEVEPLGQKLAGAVFKHDTKTRFTSRFSSHNFNSAGLLTSPEQQQKVTTWVTLTKTNNRRKAACKAHLQTLFFTSKKTTYQGALIWCLSGEKSEMLPGEQFACKTDFIL
jgi:hypothetical protein